MRRNVFYIKNKKSEIYLSILVRKRDTKIWHCTQNSDKGLDCITVDHRPILFEVFGCESTLMNNSVNWIYVSLKLYQAQFSIVKSFVHKVNFVNAK